MTFSGNIKKEFIEEIPHKTCCRRAMAYGLLFDAFLDGDKIHIDLSDIEHADFCRRVFERQFSKEVTVTPVKKAGREHFRVSFEFASVAKKISVLDKEGAQIRDYLEFKCPYCRMNFLRCIFLSRGTLTSAPSNNHLEYRIQSPCSRAMCPRYRTLRHMFLVPDCI